MNKTSMTIRTDSDVKKQAQNLFANLGLDMSTAVNMFLRQSIRYNGLPFDIRLDIPNETTLKAINESKEMLKQRNTKRFSSVDELFADLDTE